MDDLTIAVVRMSAEDAAELRYRIARKLDRMVIANRIARRANTWVMRAGEDRRG